MGHLKDALGVNLGTTVEAERAPGGYTRINKQGIPTRVIGTRFFNASPGGGWYYIDLNQFESSHL